MSDTDLASTASEPGAPAPGGVIPLTVPAIRGNEWAYIKECLDTNWVSSAGAFVSRFERMVADRVGRKHGIATVNGTAALHVALLVAGVGPDDEVLVSSLTFIAPANAVRYVGAWPVFIDAEPQYWQMDPQKLHDFLRLECRWQGGALRNKTTGRRVRAILPVDILGHPVDLDPILTIARESELAVVEDATESLGARYMGRPVGQHGDIACFSFNGNKIVTTGAGGMVVTDHDRWAEQARYLSTQAKDDPVEYVHHAIGYNYRLSNLQAAMGVAQLERLDEYVTEKRRVARTYGEALADRPGIRPMPEAPWASSTFWLYTVLVDHRLYGMSSRGLMQTLHAASIQTRPLWQPVHLSRAHAGSQSYHCEVAEALHRDALSLPCSVGLRLQDQQRVIDSVIEPQPAVPGAREKV